MTAKSDRQATLKFVLQVLPMENAVVGMLNAALPPVSLMACSCTKLMYAPPGLLATRTP